MYDTHNYCIKVRYKMRIFVGLPISGHVRGNTRAPPTHEGYHHYLVIDTWKKYQFFIDRALHGLARKQVFDRRPTRGRDRSRSRLNGSPHRLNTVMTVLDWPRNEQPCSDEHWIEGVEVAAANLASDPAPAPTPQLQHPSSNAPAPRYPLPASISHRRFSRTEQATHDIRPAVIGHEMTGRSHATSPSLPTGTLGSVDTHTMGTSASHS